VDTDGDGSWDGIEIKFSTTGANPIVKQATLVVKSGTSVVSVYYPYDGGSATIKNLQGTTLLSLTSSDYNSMIASTTKTITKSGYTIELKLASANEPPWAPLAKELAPHLIYEDMNQEFPTSIFFDDDRDMSNNGVPSTWPGGGQRIYEKDDIVEVDATTKKYLTLETWVTSSTYTPSTPPEKYIEVRSVDENTGAWTVYVWRDGWLEGYASISADTTTLIGTYNLKDSNWPVEIYGYSQKSTDNKYRFYIFHEDISIQQYKGKSYYAKTLTEKKNLATTYMQAYEGDVDIDPSPTVTTNHKMLGIQYWFYYPYHDGPEISPVPHQHDWWYVWVVYDMTDKKPTKAIYDFHHNLRVYDWTITIGSQVINNPRVSRDGFHTKVYIDAGGHRSMFAPGQDISSYTAGVLGKNKLYDMFETTDMLTAKYTTKLFGISFTGTLSEKGHGNVWGGDEVFGAMIKGLYYGKAGYEGTPEKNIADWRYSIKEDRSVYTHAIQAPRGEYAADEANKKLKVEDFHHWVWVAGVDDTYDADNSKVDFTWSGSDVHNIQGVDSKGTPLKYLWPKADTYLPWRSDKSWAKGDQSTNTLVSSTELVWRWWAYDYVWGGTANPSAKTRYYDGSG
jgi:hypothetical protein